MIIDVHAHIGRLNISQYWTASAAEVEAAVEWAGVDYCVVSSSKALIYDIREGNQEVLSAVDSYPRLLGYMVATPTFPEESIEDLKRVAGHPRLVGCKMHPDYHGYDASSCETHRLMEHVARYVRVVLFHTSNMPPGDFASAEKLLGLAAEHPETDFIFAHAAGLNLSPLYPYHANFHRCIDKIAEAGLGNVYIDTASGTLLGFPSMLETAVAKLGADRILFATDFPIVTRSRARSYIEDVRDANLSDEQRNQILSLNALKLLRKAGVAV